MTSPQSPPTRPQPRLPDPGGNERGRGAEPRRAKPSLLSRDDWGTAIILAAIIGIVSFIAGFLGALMGGAWI